MVCVGVGNCYFGCFVVFCVFYCFFVVELVCYGLFDCRAVDLVLAVGLV